MMKIKFLAAIGLMAFLAACSGSDDNAGNTAGTGATVGGNGAGLTLHPGQVAPGSQEDFVASAGDRVYFALDYSTLSSDARATLDRQAEWLNRYPEVRVQIAGNCDDRGTEEYNVALGQRRANAARDYLVAKGISADRISTISYGKERPVALGSDEQARAQNRNAITSVR